MVTLGEPPERWRLDHIDYSELTYKRDYSDGHPSESITYMGLHPDGDPSSSLLKDGGD